MKVYPVYASDLEGLEVFSTIATVAIGVISLIVGFALNIWWDWKTSPIDSPKQVYGGAVLIVSAAFSIGALVVLHLALKKKNKVRHRLEEESYELKPMP